ncbi:MAG TPA: hypothetical protein VGC42_26055 [Kofleriaceae bacterium]
MNDSRKPVESDTTNELPAKAPLFRRYQIKVKAGFRVGAAPTGHPPLGF